MKTFIYTIILLFCCTFLSAQQDSLLKKHNYCFSIGGHYNYQDQKEIPYTGSWIIIDGLRVQNYKSSFALNGELTYLYNKKWFLAKTGFLFYNIKQIAIYNLDSSLKYLPDKSKQLVELKRSMNSFLLPLMVGAKYKKFQLLFGENLFLFDILSGRNKYYDSSSQQIISNSGFRFDEVLRLSELWFSPSATLQYLIYKGKYNFFTSMDIFYIERRFNFGLSLVLMH